MNFNFLSTIRNNLAEFAAIKEVGKKWMITLRERQAKDLTYYACRCFLPKSTQVRHVESKNSNIFRIELHLEPALIVKLEFYSQFA